MLELKGTVRKETGKIVKHVRNQGYLPGVLYGVGIESVPVSVNYKDFEKTYREAGGSTLVKLSIDGFKTGDETLVLIVEPRRNPVSDAFIHVDFYKVPLDEKIKVELPVEYVGESPAVQFEGGILVKNFHEIEVEGFPHKLPREIEVDISRLEKVNDDIFVRDIPVPEGIEILADPDAVIASVQPPRSEEELQALEGAPEEKLEEVEVVGKKPEEGEEAGEDLVAEESESQKE